MHYYHLSDKSFPKWFTKAHTDPTNFNLSAFINAIIVSKHFWKEVVFKREALTHKHFEHILGELSEVIFELEQDELNIEKLRFEIADVCIIMFDLLGAYNQNVDATIVLETVTSPAQSYEFLLLSFIEAIGRCANKYRKQKLIVYDDDWKEAFRAMKRLSQEYSFSLLEYIMKKMLINSKRPKLYGVKK